MSRVAAGKEDEGRGGQEREEKNVKEKGR